MHRFTIAVAAGLSATSACLAGNASVDYNDARGVPLARVVITHPTKDVTQDHIRSVFVLPLDEASSGFGSSSSSRIPEVARFLDSSTTERESLVDWSGYHIRMERLAGGGCSTIVVGASGFVGRDQSIFYDLDPASAVTTVVLPTKGDPDLYVRDVLGTTLCQSTNVKKIPEDCHVFAFSCAPFSSVVEIYGFKRRNEFVFASWLTTVS